MSKKQLIMDKALKLFAEQGFEATSVQQITDYCSISKGAFYLSFKSKDELINALFDQFMETITADIDLVVKTTSKDQLLYTFYFHIFNSLHKHSDFSKIVMKEQTHTLNKERLHKLYHYNKILDKIILSMIERLYGEENKDLKYDLIYCIKSFVRMYFELFFVNHIPIDIQLLTNSLVEKTNLLARETRIPFLTEDLMQATYQSINGELTEEQMVELLDQKIAEMDNNIAKDSLILLKNHLINPTLNTAIVKGLLENIRKHPHCKWVYYVLSNYYQLTD